MHDYIVRHGESLSSISQKFSVSTEVLARINGLDPADALSEKQTLKVPVLILIYRLHDGESEYTIAESLQVSPSQITKTTSDGERSLIVLFGSE